MRALTVDQATDKDFAAKRYVEKRWCCDMLRFEPE
jgi:hypothetical protein